MLAKGNVFGNPYVGVYCAANEFMALIPAPSSSVLEASIRDTLELEVVLRSSVDGGSTLGSLVRLNSNGAVVSSFMSHEEMQALAAHIPVTRIDHRLNAMGNNVLANDNGALVHPGFNKETARLISKALGVPVERGTIAGYRTVGSAAVATNKGVICHPHATEHEMEVLEKLLDVPVYICTANYGTGQVGACMVANSRGALVGETTTPIEMGHIEEGLVLY